MKKMFRFATVLVILAMILSACQAATPTAVVEPTEAPAQPTEAPVVETEAPVVETEAPTEAPTEAATEAPTEAPTEAAPSIADKVNMDYEGSIVAITLKPGLKWSDGSDLTADDIVGSYQLSWANNAAVWTWLENVEAVDDLTAVFYLKENSMRIIRYLLRTEMVYPRSVFGEWMDKAAEFRAANVDRKADADFLAFWEEFNAFKPTEAVVNGPFVPDMSTYSEAQIELVKNPLGYNADNIDFDKILVYYGETNACTPLNLTGELDYSTHAYPPAVLEQFKTLPNYHILQAPMGNGPSVEFNYAVHPFEIKEVRQAFAYIIDRTENAVVAFGDAAKPVKYMSGMPDAAVEGWIPGLVPELNTYEKDWAKAEELLTAAGMEKRADGWYDDTGKKMEYKLWVPGTWIDYLGSSTNAAEQLSNFGIAVEVQPYQDAERTNVKQEGKFDLLMDIGFLYNPPHPYRSYEFVLTPPMNNPGDPRPGIGFPMEWTTPDGEEVNLKELVDNISVGLDAEAQKPYIETMVKLFNEEMFTVPLWERFTTDPINIADRVTGWKPWDDVIWLNNQGADNYVSMQFLDGTLKPTDTNTDKVFTYCNPYVQPPKGHFNTYIADSLPASFLTIGYNSLYVPLFFYMHNTNEYIPYLAESYEVLK